MLSQKARLEPLRTLHEARASEEFGMYFPASMSYDKICQLTMSRGCLGSRNSNPTCEQGVEVSRGGSPFARQFELKAKSGSAFSSLLFLRVLVCWRIIIYDALSTNHTCHHHFAKSMASLLKRTALSSYSSLILTWYRQIRSEQC